ncbi:MAG: ABC-type transport auxiliary lipoprotein family protein [Steroidobacteraceae bacterium]
MKSLLATAALLACGLLAGCLGGLKNDVPAPVIYRISAPEIAAAGETLAADLLVTVESTAPGLDGTGIAGRWPGLRVDYLAGARWPVRTPALVESALIEALQDTGRLRSVQGKFGRFGTTHTLALEVRRFEADYTAGELPVAQVALAVTLGRLADRQVLASFTVEAEEPASANRVSAVVAAIDAAFGRAAGELAARSLEAIAADLAQQPRAAVTASQEL